MSRAAAKYASRIMEPHPDFAGKPPPRMATFGQFVLEVLAPQFVDEDYAVVIGSTSVLTGLFGQSWPEGLTLEENLADLIRHEREFDNDQAFAWIIRSEAGLYLGCAYLYPTPEKRGEGRVFTWIRDREDRLDLLDEFNRAFKAWLSDYLPEGFALSWTSNDR